MNTSKGQKGDDWTRESCKHGLIGILMTDAINGNDYFMGADGCDDYGYDIFGA